MGNIYKFETHGFWTSLWMIFRKKYDVESSSWIVEVQSDAKVYITKEDNELLERLTQAYKPFKNCYLTKEVIDKTFDYVAYAIFQKHSGNLESYELLTSQPYEDWTALISQHIEGQWEDI